jgi:hypothetical protein
VIRLSKAGGISADRGEVRTRCCLGAAFRSDTILAVNKIPDNVKLTGNGNFWVEKNETPINTSEAINSRLLSGVIGAAGLGWDSRLRRQNGLIAPGTASPQV